MQQKRILGFIPARGGSKGLPGKNIRLLCKKPLIAWTIEHALASQRITRVVVSTDDQEIAAVAKRYKADVPFLRPRAIASDHAPMADAMVHALDYYKTQGQEFDYIVLLEPTSPLRKEGDLDRAIDLLITHEKNIDSVISLGEIHVGHPAVVKKIKNGKLLPFLTGSELVQRRQDLGPVYFPFGVVYVVKTKNFIKTRTVYQKRSLPYLIERWQNYEIDDYCDFLCIEAILSKKLKGIEL